MVFPKLYIHSLQKCPSCVKHVVPLEPDILGDFGEEGVVLLKVLLLAPLSWNLPAAHKNQRIASQGSSPISGNLFLKDSSTTISSTMANPGNPTADATLWLCISRLLAVNTKAAPPPLQLHTFPPNNPFEFCNVSHSIHAYPTLSRRSSTTTFDLRAKGCWHLWHLQSDSLDHSSQRGWAPLR